MSEGDSVCINLCQIENKLQYFEKVSLVFLIYDDPHVALEYLLMVRQGAERKLLEEWSTVNKKLNWRDILVEALVITQCFDVLRNMGYTKDKLNSLKNKNPSLIHHTKKKLFSICEKLNIDETSKFIKHIKKIILSEPKEFQEYEEEYLELYFLHWLTINFITIDNIENIELALKALQEENRYYMDSNNAGICLIINQEHFYNEVDKKWVKFLPKEKLNNRVGTNVDKNMLIETFSRFGFDIILEENRDHEQIVESIKKVTNTKFEKRHCCLIVCILSHGIEGQIYGNNSIPVSVRHIQNLMCDQSCINLRGKPKILLLQSCQGTKMMEAIETDGIKEVSPNYDLFVFWSTVPGFASIRNVIDGTWFIQSFCKKLIQYSKLHHFEEIATRVINDVSEKKDAITPGEQVTMLPCKQSTFRKELYLSSKPNYLS